MNRRDRKKRGSGRNPRSGPPPWADAQQAAVRQHSLAIEDALTEAITSHGYDLIDVKLDGRRHLRVTIDVPPVGPRGAPAKSASHDGDGGPEGAGALAKGASGPPPGVRIADCQAVSELTAAVLTGMGHDPGGFQIEIASPGVDRPLTRPEHFVRFRGDQVTLTLKRARVDGRRNFTGRLIDADEGSVTVHVLDTDDPERFERGEVAKVRLRSDAAPPPREEPSRRALKRRGHRDKDAERAARAGRGRAGAGEAAGGGDGTAGSSGAGGAASEAGSGTGSGAGSGAGGGSPGERGARAGGGRGKRRADRSRAERGRRNASDDLDAGDGAPERDVDRLDLDDE